MRHVNQTYADWLDVAEVSAPPYAAPLGDWAAEATAITNATLDDVLTRKGALVALGILPCEAGVIFDKYDAQEGFSKRVQADTRRKLWTMDNWIAGERAAKKGKRG